MNGIFILIPKVIYVNAEEEVIEEKATMSLTAKSGSAEAPKIFDWSETSYEERHQVLVFEKEKSEEIISSIRNAFPMG